MEAPDLPNPVQFLAACAHHSRLGPVVGVEEGVFHLACSGKYQFFPLHSICDEFSHHPRPTIRPQISDDILFELPTFMPHSPLDSLPPGRIVESSTEAPNPSNPVVPTAASVHHSRPGPVVGCGTGVFQPEFSGKYLSNAIYPPPDADQFSMSSSNTISRGTSSRTSILELGRTVESLTRAPSPSDPVEPTAASVHRSRPGPVVGSGTGVFQAATSGEYPCDADLGLRLLVPDVSNFRTGNGGIRANTISNENVFIYYQNAGGMNCDVNDYRLATSDDCFDIIVLTETWLDSRTLSSQVFGSAYEVFRCDRCLRNSRKITGGGVLVAVNNKLKARIIENDSWASVEQVWVRIELSNRTVFLCAIYIPPDRTRDDALIDVHTQSIMSVIETATATDEVIILGDLNLPGISWRSSHNGFLHPDPDHSQLHSGATRLLDCYSAATLRQINNVTNENNRSLDLCFVSAQDIAPLIYTAPSPLVKRTAHHPPLIVALQVCQTLELENTTPVSYDFRKADHRSIDEFLSGIDWENVLDRNDAESAVQTLSHILVHAIERHVPKKVQNRTGLPWQTRELRNLKTAKRAALRRFSKHRTLGLREHYVRLNHEYRKMSRNCFSRFQRNIQRKLKSHPKSFWKYVNDQRKESGLPLAMNLNGEIGYDPQEICRLFASKFASVFSDEEISDENVALAASNVPLLGETLGSINVDDAMISRATSQLKSSMNPGPDGIPSVFLKKHIDCLLTPIRHVFCLSLDSGVFPSLWKRANVFPVHKKGDRKDINNYRGISSLCAISKLFELVVMDPLMSHCKSYLSNDQHGFVSGRSTTTNLLCLTTYVADCLAERVQTDVIYTDLTAAFDKINHSITIAKLERLGVNGVMLRWFHSYLTGRHLTAMIEGYQSDIFPATSGIPQGTHLGPLIFLLYFNDVNFVLDGPRLSYADDFKMFLRIRSLSDAITLQRQLDAFTDWCTLNRMEVNPNKCSVISFSRIQHPIFFTYNLQGIEIQRVDHVKDLGVILDSQLTFKHHVSYVVDKASRTMGFIFRIAKDFTDVYCIKSLYCSLVRSTLEYCSAIWYPYYQNGVERIESVQRRFIRFALRSLPWRDPFRLPSYESRCQLIHLETLWVRRDINRAMLVADTLQGRVDCPAVLEHININVRPRAFRNNVMLRLPLRRTNYGLNCAMVGLQRVFNRVASAFDFHLPRQTLRRNFAALFLGR